MEGVFFAPQIPGRARRLSHAVMRHISSGDFITCCQHYPIALHELQWIDERASIEAVECEKCRLLASRKPPPEPTAADRPVIAGGVLIRRSAKHLSHDQVVNAGILKLLNTEGRSFLPPACFFTSEADRQRGGQAVLRIVDAFDDPQLLQAAMDAVVRSPH